MSEKEATAQQHAEYDSIKREAVALLARALAAGLTLQITHTSCAPLAQGNIRHHVSIGLLKATHDLTNEALAVQRQVIALTNDETRP